jgi:subtilisin family serine protease
MNNYIVLRDRSNTRLSTPMAGGRGRMRGFERIEAAAPPIATVEVGPLSGRDLLDRQRDPEVRAIAPSMPIKLIKATEATGIDATAAAAAPVWGISAVKADTSPFGGGGVTVCVLDTGIDAGHVAFQGVNITQMDFSSSGNGDAQGHGTHCAGTIFGRNVDGKRIGVAPGVTKALIGKVLGNDGRGSSEAMFKGVSWAIENKAHVISMSLGFDFPGYVDNLVQGGARVDVATSLALDGFLANVRVFDEFMQLNAALGAFGSSAIVVAASGNESGRDERPPFRVSTSLPAAATDVISVGAARQHGATYAIASFSNTNADVCAPGVGILSARRGGGLVALDGTSMATPHVAGVVALWWQAVLSSSSPKTAQTVLARLLATCRNNVFSTDTDPIDVGAGLITAPQNAI